MKENTINEIQLIKDRIKEIVQEMTKSENTIIKSNLDKTLNSYLTNLSRFLELSSRYDLPKDDYSKIIEAVSLCALDIFLPLISINKRQAAVEKFKEKLKNFDKTNE